ncbi:rCG33638 [Rattus norvegicus]|uniref:RCG33638 n=1 Tax=Rattus norvegicus TaxID=10116 RepID=A6HKC2_RAT|nr:rCG33638 [Rattus norvegicus]
MKGKPRTWYPSLPNTETQEDNDSCLALKLLFCKQTGDCAKHFSRNRSVRAMPGTFTLRHGGWSCNHRHRTLTEILSALHPWCWGWTSGPDAYRASTY